VDGDADRLVDHDDGVVVVDDLDALDDLGHDLERVGRAGIGTSSSGPGTRSLLPTRRPST
jgi:hypothetical protein